MRFILGFNRWNIDKIVIVKILNRIVFLIHFYHIYLFIHAFIN